MRTLALAALAAATASIPAMAAAQSGPPPGAQVRIQSGAGHWRSQGPRMHSGQRFRHHRLRPGMQIHPFWFGPQFHVQNWQLYGFRQPAPDHRWVRYYDDAYLIDREGHVRDTRYGLDWDRYGEPWGDEGGVPRYVGDGDFHPEERDYAWVEEHDRYAGGDDYGDDGYGPAMAHDDYGYPPPPHGCQPAAPQPCGGYGYGNGAGYGYGYGHPCGQCWTVTIVETTVTPMTYRVVETVEEEIIETRPRARRGKKRTVRRNPPPPPPGERG